MQSLYFGRLLNNKKVVNSAIAFRTISEEKNETENSRNLQQSYEQTF